MPFTPPRHLAAALAALLLCTGAGTALPGTGASSTWVSLQNNKLVYKTTPKGDRIMDFSSAGYGGGGIPLPAVPVAKTLSPSGSGDDTPAIQSAINDVSKMPLVNGLRGAILLKAGVYNCSAVLSINASGVVLRGEGTSLSGTVIHLAGKPHEGISLEGEDNSKLLGHPASFQDPYVPSGTLTVAVDDPAPFKPGDEVTIFRPATEKWVHFMGMDNLQRTGKSEHWVSGKLPTDRTIVSIAGNQITLNAPLTDSFDAQYINPPGGTIEKSDHAGHISQVGVENLRITAPPQHVEITAALFRGMGLANVENAWVKDVEIVDTTTAVSIGSHTARVTIENVGITHSTATVGAAKPADFNAEGTQILLDKCRSKGDDTFYFVTGARVTGPVVLLNCTFHGGGSIQPHQRWATGLLLDNCDVPEGGIDLIDRGVMGSGHGWTIGWSVAWNCSAKSFEIEQPPGSMNWAIGCHGAINKVEQEPGSKIKVPEGTYDCHNTPVAPSSLYLTQLQERLGPTALKNIGY